MGEQLLVKGQCYHFTDRDGRKRKSKKLMINSNRLVNEEILERMNLIDQENPYSLSKNLELAQVESAVSNDSGLILDMPSATPSIDIQQSFNFGMDMEISLSPETMIETMDSLNMSIRKTAEEIGIAHTTLSRYLRRENKRQNNKNDEKMLGWLKEKKKI